jgi:hypothetical protein
MMMRSFSMPGAQASPESACQRWLRQPTAPLQYATLPDQLMVICMLLGLHNTWQSLENMNVQTG